MRIRNFVIIVALFVYGLGSTVIAAPKEDKVAVIDIQKVVAASPYVKELKKSQQAKSKEIKAFIKMAQAEVKKQKTPEEKQKVAIEYEKQLSEKRSANMKEYAKKLKETEALINEQIGKKARSMGYTVIIPRAIVIYGGTDITKDMIKAIK